MKIISSVRKTISLVILMILVDIGRFQCLPGPLLRSSIMIIIVIVLIPFSVFVHLPPYNKDHHCYCPHYTIPICHLMIDIRCWAVTYPLFSSSNCWKIWSRTYASLFWCVCLLFGSLLNYARHAANI